MIKQKTPNKILMIKKTPLKKLIEVTKEERE